MGKLSYFLCFALAAFFVACAGNTTVPTDTPADRAALCIRSVTTARQAATALLRAGRITLERDRAIQDDLNTAREGCAELAKGSLQ